MGNLHKTCRGQDIPFNQCPRELSDVGDFIKKTSYTPRFTIDQVESAYADRDTSTTKRSYDALYVSIFMKEDKV